MQGEKEQHWGDAAEMNSPDSPVAILMRRYWSNEAGKRGPFEPYDVALAKICQYVPEDELHTLVDIGCSSGQFVIESVGRAEFETPPNIIGVDIKPEAAVTFFMPSGARNGNFTYMQGDALALPLPDNSVDAVMAHNVLFRTQTAEQVLAEITRVLRPDGVAVVSSNFEGHAEMRHHIAHLAVRAVAHEY
jgi:ubiquinone/menaquinone biosynthesis C-methylase UbiE